MDLPRIIKKEKEAENKQMTQNETFKKIDEWIEDYEVRLIGDDLEALKKEIWKAVQKERLSYDSSKEQFTYVLKTPIEKKDNSGSISILILQEREMNEKRDIAKHENFVDSGVELYHAYCEDTEGEEIPIGFLSRIKDRDQNILNAVILGFFLQAIPDKARK